MWPSGKLVPDHKTVADFRRNHGAGIRKVCAQFVELCRRIGTLKGDCAAIDCGKFKAVNNRDRNFGTGKIASRLAHLEADVRRDITDIVRIDRQEEREARTGKVAHLPRRHGRTREEIERLKAKDQALADVPAGQISLTDPDARATATSARHSGMVGYNVQTAVDTETHIIIPIVAHWVTKQGFDRDQFGPTATTAKDALGRADLHAFADKGYFSNPDVLACKEARSPATLPRPDTPGNVSESRFVKADLPYDATRDVCVWLAGEALITRTTPEERGRQLRRHWINQCQTCPLQSRCTNGTERRIARWEHTHLVDDMGSPSGPRPDPVTLRRCTVEHPFGKIKTRMGATRFRTRSLKNVRTEMALNVLACSVMRTVNLIGMRRPMGAIPGLGRPDPAEKDPCIALTDLSLRQADQDYDGSPAVTSRHLKRSDRPTCRKVPNTAGLSGWPWSAGVRLGPKCFSKCLICTAPPVTLD